MLNGSARSAMSMRSDETGTAVDVLVPTSYSFPSAGTILGLAFILFHDDQ